MIMRPDDGTNVLWVSAMIFQDLRYILLDAESDASACHLFNKSRWSILWILPRSQIEEERVVPVWLVRIGMAHKEGERTSVIKHDQARNLRIHDRCSGQTLNMRRRVDDADADGVLWRRDA